MREKWLALAIAGVMGLSACSGTPADDGANSDAMANGTVSLRNLAETDVAAPAPATYTVKGDQIPTPSDTASRYFLLRERRAVGGNVIAILRQEHAGRVAYARTEIDCGKRLFHVLGVASKRALAETNIAYDGPLRPIAGLPLREELASFICTRSGTPLTAS